MNRRFLLRSSFLSLVVSACTSGGQQWRLVTAEEAARDSAAPVPRSGLFGQQGGTRGIQVGPTILVEQPDPTKPLHPPLSFRVRFVPESGAVIVPGTFHASYGFLGLDITSRLLQHSHFTGQELVADNVDVPVGNHVVTLAIADSLGHEASRKFQFTVS